MAGSRWNDHARACGAHRVVIDKARCLFLPSGLARGKFAPRQYPLRLFYATSAIAIGIVTAAKMVCSVMICANSGASPPICRASTYALDAAGTAEQTATTARL